MFALAIGVLGVIKAIRVYRRTRRTAAGDAGRLVDQLTGTRAAYVDEASVTPGQRRLAAVAYFGLIAVLCVLMSVSDLPSR